MPFAIGKNNLYVVNHSELGNYPISFIFLLKGLVLSLLKMLLNFSNVFTMSIPHVE